MSDHPTSGCDLTEAAVRPAARLVAIVHGDGDVNDVADLLEPRSTRELHALAVVLAAMVDPGKTITELLQWTDLCTTCGAGKTSTASGKQLRPHGTHAAFQRHKANGTHPCAACTEGERAYQAARWTRKARPRTEDAA